MSLTAANSVITLVIHTVFNQPQTLQGYAADDVYDSDELDAAETQMGVDGKLSGGFVFVSFKQAFAIMADSPSAAVFDTWYAQNQSNQETFIANGVITLPAIGRKFTLTRGFLRGYKPLPDAKKLLIARRFRIEWQSVSGAPS